MGLDSYSRKNLEQRAKDKGRAIDTQWIKENETNDIVFGKISSFNSSINESNILSNYSGEERKKYVEESRLGVEESLNKLKNILSEIESAAEKESQVDNMIEAMAQGIDVLGEHNNEISQSNIRRMGFTEVWLLGLITIIVSVGIIVLGIILTK